jgi:hypothetical protein
MARGQQGKPVAAPTQVQLVTLEEPARFTGIVPGNYQVCLAADSVRPGGGAADGGTQPFASTCQSVSVSLSPAEQSLMVMMPAP